MRTLFDVHPWQLTQTALYPEHLRLCESITSMGNGLMGMRGNFEEQYTGDTHRGTYLAGVWFPDKTRVGWWKNGYPQYFGKVINAMNLIALRVRVAGQEIDLGVLPVEAFTRTLDMRTGVLTREATVRLPGEQGTVRLRVTRFVSVAQRELLAIRYEVTAENACTIDLLPTLDADVHNLDSNYGERFWEHGEHGQQGDTPYLVSKTRENPFGTPRFSVAASMRSQVTGGTITQHIVDVQPTVACEQFTLAAAAGETVRVDKLVAVSTSRNHGEDALSAVACAAADAALATGFDALRAAHEADWAARWDKADVRIDGDDAAQQGIRFNLFQLFSTYYGEDARLNIGPKGFTGEKYGGATYWDTEAYCLPLYLAVAGQDVARNLLRYRHLQLDGAYHNARQQGLPGALYPMVTFTGIECHNEWEITFEEIHRNAAIAFAIFHYVRYTGDEAYLTGYGIEVLAGIAAFWAGRVHEHRQKGCFMIHGVTGPNEYENNVNNNWYTNRMAAWCLSYTVETAARLTPERRTQLGLEEATLARYADIAARMYLPYDGERDIFVQHDTFLDKDLMPASSLPQEDRPINQHWSWDRILRSCFIKQADTLQGLYFLGHLYDADTKRRNFAFYEPMTVHESSLSPCVHSILAAEIGELDKAVEMYQRTARLDLDDLNNDTHDGLHITSMAGSWLSIAHGFAGMRTVEGLAFAPFLPACWQGYAFTIVYRSRCIRMDVQQKAVTLSLLEGEPLDVTLWGQSVRLADTLTQAMPA